MHRTFSSGFEEVKGSGVFELGTDSPLSLQGEG